MRKISNLSTSDNKEEIYEMGRGKRKEGKYERNSKKWDKKRVESVRKSEAKI